MTAARIAAALLALAALAGLGTQFIASSASHPDDTPLQVAWSMLRFFTILTNVIVLAVFTAIAAGRPARPGLCGAVTLWIAIVGVVYWVLLAPTSDPQGWGVIANTLLHTVTPAGTVLWWLAFAPKRALSWRAPLLWMLWPLVYVFYAMLRGAADGVYPYFFVDAGRLGYGGVAANSAGLALAFGLAGLALVALGRAIGRPEGRYSDRPG